MKTPEKETTSRREFGTFSLKSLLGLTAAVALGVRGCMYANKQSRLAPLRQQWDAIGNRFAVDKSDRHYPYDLEFVYYCVMSTLQNIKGHIVTTQDTWNDIASETERIERLQPIARAYLSVARQKQLSGSVVDTHDLPIARIIELASTADIDRSALVSDTEFFAVAAQQARAYFEGAHYWPPELGQLDVVRLHISIMDTSLQQLNMTREQAGILPKDMHQLLHPRIQPAWDYIVEHQDSASASVELVEALEWAKQELGATTEAVYTAAEYREMLITLAQNRFNTAKKFPDRLLCRLNIADMIRFLEIADAYFSDEDVDINYDAILPLLNNPGPKIAEIKSHLVDRKTRP